MTKQEDPRRDLWWFLATGDVLVGPVIDWLLAKSLRTRGLAAVVMVVLAWVLCWLVYL